jgi:hypothetical protein
LWRAIDGSGGARRERGEGVIGARTGEAIGGCGVLTIDGVERSGILSYQESFASGRDPFLERGGGRNQVANLIEKFSIKGASVFSNGGVVRDFREVSKTEELRRENTEIRASLRDPHDLVKGFLLFVRYTEVL